MAKYYTPKSVADGLPKMARNVDRETKRNIMPLNPLAVVIEKWRDLLEKL